jgi:hypothetical protein
LYCVIKIDYLICANSLCQNLLNLIDLAFCHKTIYSLLKCINQLSEFQLCTCQTFFRLETLNKTVENSLVRIPVNQTSKYPLTWTIIGQKNYKKFPFRGKGVCTFCLVPQVLFRHATALNTSSNIFCQTLLNQYFNFSNVSWCVKICDKVVAYIKKYCRFFMTQPYCIFTGWQQLTLCYNFITFFSFLTIFRSLKIAIHD